MRSPFRTRSEADNPSSRALARACASSGSNRTVVVSLRAIQSLYTSFGRGRNPAGNPEAAPSYSRTEGLGAEGLPRYNRPSHLGDRLTSRAPRSPSPARGVPSNKEVLRARPDPDPVLRFPSARPPRAPWSRRPFLRGERPDLRLHEDGRDRTAAGRLRGPRPATLLHLRVADLRPAE